MQSAVTFLIHYQNIYFTAMTIWKITKNSRFNVDSQKMTSNLKSGYRLLYVKHWH